MLENVPINIFIILIGILGFIFLLSLFFIFFLVKKRRETTENIFKNLPENLILLKISEEFKKETEILIRNQVEKSYRELVASIFPEIKNSILINAEKFGKQLNLLAEGAEKDISRFRELSQSIYQELINENKKSIERVSQSFLLESKGKMDSLSARLEREASQVFKDVKIDVDEKIKEAEKIIEERKKEKIKEIENNIYRILNDVAKKTLGKTLDFSTHEELVMKALEKAKKENFF